MQHRKGTAFPATIRHSFKHLRRDQDTFKKDRLEIRMSANNFIRKDLEFNIRAIEFISIQKLSYAITFDNVQISLSIGLFST